MKDYQSKNGREYIEDQEPLPVMIYERDPRTKEFKANKQKSIIPKSVLN